MLEVEQAAMGSEAQGRLAEMRQSMGLGPGAGAEPSLPASAPGEIGTSTAPLSHADPKPADGVPQRSTNPKP